MYITLINYKYIILCNLCSALGPFIEKINGVISMDLNIIDNLLNTSLHLSDSLEKMGVIWVSGWAMCVHRFQNILHEFKIVGLIEMFVSLLYVIICTMHFLVRILWNVADVLLPLP